MVYSRCHVFSHADRIRDDETLLRQGEKETARQKERQREKKGRSKSRMSREDGKGPRVTARAGFLK